MKSPLTFGAIKHGSFAKSVTNDFASWGDKMAVIDGQTEKGYKYSELSDVLTTIRGNLYHKARLRKGDVICVYAPNSVEFALLLLAAPSIGGIISGINPLFLQDEVIKQMDDSNAKYLVIDSGHRRMLPKLLAARPQIREVYVIGDKIPGLTPFETLLRPTRAAPHIEINAHEDLALLPYSSGTTGTAKGVMITHSNMAHAITSVLQPDIAAYKEGKDISVIVFPLCHIGGTMNFYAAVNAGCTLIFFSKFDLEGHFAAIEKYKATHMFVPPPLIVALAKHPAVSKYDLSSVKYLFYGGAPTSPGLQVEALRHMPNIEEYRQVYGQTENTGICSIQYLTNGGKEGSVGKAIPPVILKVVDIETGEELPVEEEGEIVLGGPLVMKGYLNNPDKTAETIKNGWLHTGDIGKRDSDDNVYITDRLKELIKYKGYQVAPAEIEILLVTHPAVAMAAVIGVPDLQAGELPRAFVVLKAGQKATEDDIKGFVKEHLASYKQLRGGVEFVSEIPIAPSGKILRRLLRETKMPLKNTKSRL